VPQYPKDEIRAGICRAALAVMAEQGYRSARMSEIARAAGVSTGNVYRYFPSKRRLYQAVVPPEFTRAFTRLLGRRIRALRGRDVARALAPGDPYRAAVDELLGFATQHRLKLVLLLGRSEDTPHAGFAQALVAHLVRLAIGEQRAITPAFRASRTTRFALAQIYQNFVGALVEVLREFDQEADIRRAADELGAYHLVGLTHLLARAAARTGPIKPAGGTRNGKTNTGHRRHRQRRPGARTPTGRARSRG
jgi:AcrR family transcriptional regulator